MHVGESVCAWRFEQCGEGDFRPRLVSGGDADFEIGSLYGLFAKQREANNTLRKIAEAYQLCPIVLGLKKTARQTMSGSRACFVYQLHQCKGACIGKEPISLHSARMMSGLAKLKLKAWPYGGPVGLVEREGFLDLEDVHLVDNWRYLGTAKSDIEVDELLSHAAQVPFDRDTYRLLLSHLVKGKVSVRRF